MGFSFGKKEQSEAVAEAKRRWMHVSPENHEPYVLAARTHDFEQPTVHDRILEELRKSPTSTYEAASNAVDGWTSSTAINAWLKSHCDFKMYSQHVVPLLSLV